MSGNGARDKPPAEYIESMRRFLTDCGFDAAQIDEILASDPSPNAVIFTAVAALAERTRRIETWITNEIIKRSTNRIITPGMLE